MLEKTLSGRLPPLFLSAVSFEIFFKGFILFYCSVSKTGMYGRGRGTHGAEDHGQESKALYLVNHRVAPLFILFRLSSTSPLLPPLSSISRETNTLSPSSSSSCLDINCCHPSKSTPADRQHQHRHRHQHQTLPNLSS